MTWRAAAGSRFDTPKLPNLYWAPDGFASEPTVLWPRGAERIDMHESLQHLQ